MGPPDACSSRVYARVGLLGNPSDAFDGAAIAASVSNFSAEVSLEASGSSAVELVPNATLDPTSFPSLDDLRSSVEELGYYGGRRLAMVRAAPVAAL